MTFMGYETPVELPSMGVYDTDLMKLYIAGAKDQYEKAREDMKDFMKTYGDFYSDIPGATELYNKLTVDGANKLIGEMYARGIDPYKSPQAQQLIGKYVASVPVVLLNQMKRSAADAAEYKKNRDKLIAAGLYDEEQARWENGGQTLEEWDGTLGNWNRTTPSPRFDPIKEASPFFEQFKSQEWLRPSRPGYALYGTKDENKEKAIDAAMQGLSGKPGFEFMKYRANELAKGKYHDDLSPVTGEEILRDQFRTFANQFFQPAEKEDPVAMDRIRTANDIYAHKMQRDYDISHPLPSSSSSSKTTGSGATGAYIDPYTPDGYSRYNAISNSVVVNNGDNSVGEVAYYSVGKDGKRTPVRVEYKDVADKRGNIMRRYVVRVANGGDFKDSNGARYRQLSPKEAQSIVFRKVKRDANPRTSDAYWNAVAVKYGGGGEVLEYNSDLLSTLYFPADVMSKAAGIPNTFKGTYNTSSMRNLIKGYANKAASDDTIPFSIVTTDQAGDIVQKNGNIKKYKMVEVTVGGQTFKALKKIGEYDSNYNNTPEWNDRMLEDDRRESKGVVGEGDAVEIYT